MLRRPLVSLLVYKFMPHSKVSIHDCSTLPKPTILCSLMMMDMNPDSSDGGHIMRSEKGLGICEYSVEGV